MYMYGGDTERGACNACNVKDAEIAALRRRVYVREAELAHLHAQLSSLRGQLSSRRARGVSLDVGIDGEAHTPQRDVGSSEREIMAAHHLAPRALAALTVYDDPLSAAGGGSHSAASMGADGAMSAAATAPPRSGAPRMPDPVQHAAFASSAAHTVGLYHDLTASIAASFDPRKPTQSRPRKAAEYSALFGRGTSFDGVPDADGEAVLLSLFGDESERKTPRERPEDSGVVTGQEARKLATSLLQMFTRTTDYARLVRACDEFIVTTKVAAAERQTSDAHLDADWQADTSRRVREFLTGVVDVARTMEPYTMPDRDMVQELRAFSNMTEQRSLKHADAVRHTRAASQHTPMTVADALDSSGGRHRRRQTVAVLSSAPPAPPPPEPPADAATLQQRRRFSLMPEVMVQERLRHLSVVSAMAGRSPYQYWTSASRRPSASASTTALAPVPAAAGSPDSTTGKLAATSSSQPATQKNSPEDGMLSRGASASIAVPAPSRPTAAITEASLRLSHELIRVEASSYDASHGESALAAARDMLRTSALSTTPSTAGDAALYIRMRAHTEDTPSAAHVDVARAAAAGGSASQPTSPAHIIDNLPSSPPRTLHRRASRSLSPVRDDGEREEEGMASPTLQARSVSVADNLSSLPARTLSHVDTAPALIAPHAEAGVTGLDSRRVSRAGTAVSADDGDARSRVSSVHSRTAPASGGPSVLVIPPEAFDMVRNHLERYVMVELYSITYARAPEDAAEDIAVHSALQTLQWLSPDELHVPPGVFSPLVWRTAVQELRAFTSRKVPEEQLTALESACTVLYKALQQDARLKDGGAGGAGADDFLPSMIYVTLQANPPRLMSTLAYIERYRDDQQMTGRSGYCFTNLRVAVEYLRHIDAAALEMPERMFQHKRSQARAGALGAWLDSALD